MRLADEVLDKEITDCHDHKSGKVDDLLLDLTDGRGPIVRGIITQEGALAQQFGVFAQRFARWCRQHILGISPESQPRCIGWEHVTRIDVVVHIDLDRVEAGLTAAEEATWQRWIRHLPWAGRSE